MSELKVYHCNEWHNEYTEFYLKSEADNVIAEKDAEIERLKKAISNGDVNVMGWIDRCQELEEKVEMLKNSNAELENRCAYLQKLVDEKEQDGKR